MVFCFLVTVSSVYAKNSEGQPFNALWIAIEDLQSQIQNIELIPGEKGEKGDTGEQGLQGEKGDAGEDGLDGKNDKSLNLFDREGKNLGIIINMQGAEGGYGDSLNFTTYIKSVDAFFAFQSSVQSQKAVLTLGTASILFDESECGGNAFSRDGAPRQTFRKAYNSGRYFRYSGQRANGVKMYSRIPSLGEDCENFREETYSGYYMEEVSLPFDEENLVFPIEVKIVNE